MNKERFFTLSIMILAAAASRMLPHPDNIAPIAAIALFAGAKFDRKIFAFAVPLLAMLLSDAVIGFYESMWVTYAAFAAVVCIGFTLQKRDRALPVALAAVGSSVVFFLITNCPLLIHSDMYAPTLQGMLQSYTAALPFFRHSLLGDLFYTALLFGGFALAQRRFTALSPVAVKVH